MYKPLDPVGGNAKKSSIEGLLICLSITAGGLAATAGLGGLRLADLAISAVVMAGIIVLALGDSKWLSVAVMAAWMYSPLVRRLVDWQSGGYQSVTALSLLPMLATSALIIPTWSRIGSIPRRLIEPLLMIAVPVALASAAGVLLYGAGAIVEVGQWLLPMLFLPYLSTRHMSNAERFWLLRAAVLLSAAGAAYGIFQFFAPPVWDQLWLVQSEMTSSMGRPEAMQMRIWGPLNATGPASGMWSIALITVFADQRWRPALRYCCIMVLALALCLTFVRVGWIVTILGICTLAVMNGRRGGITTAATALIGGALLLALIPLLPGGDKVSDRAQTFTDLQNDNSFNERRGFAESIIAQIFAKPWGSGLGYKTADKVSGGSNGIMAVDNGYADIFYTLGFLGAAIYLLGIGLIYSRMSGPGPNDQPLDQLALVSLSRTMIISIAVMTTAAVSLIGPLAIWVWWCIGISLAPVD